MKKHINNSHSTDLDSVSAALKLFYFILQSRLELIRDNQGQHWKNQYRSGHPFPCHLQLLLCATTLPFSQVEQQVSHVFTCVSEGRRCPVEPEKFGLTLLHMKSIEIHSLKLMSSDSDGITISLLESGQKLLSNQYSLYKGNFEIHKKYLYYCQLGNYGWVDT